VEVEAPDRRRADDVAVRDEERVHVQQEVDLLGADPVRQVGIADLLRRPDVEAEPLRDAGDRRPASARLRGRHDGHEPVARGCDLPQNLDARGLLGDEKDVHPHHRSAGAVDF
jgi:hypothetical protein